MSTRSSILRPRGWGGHKRAGSLVLRGSAGHHAAGRSLDWLLEGCRGGLTATAKRMLVRGSFADAKAAEDLVEDIFDGNGPDQATQGLGGAAQVLGTQFRVLVGARQKRAERRPAPQQVLAMPGLGEGRGVLIANPRRGDRRQACNQSLQTKSFEGRDGDGVFGRRRQRAAVDQVGLVADDQKAIG